MSKRKKYKRLNRQNDQRSISNVNKLMTDLDSAIKAGRLSDDDRREALKISSLFISKGRFWLTASHKYKALSFIKQHRKDKRSAIDKKQYLYAISDGENVKLGMSISVKRRMAALQTSNSKKLHILWNMYVGRDIFKAEKAEKQLHRRCSEYKIRGEWFDLKCMLLVANFKKN